MDWLFVSLALYSPSLFLCSFLWRVKEPIVSTESLALYNPYMVVKLRDKIVFRNWKSSFNSDMVSLCDNV